MLVDTQDVPKNNFYHPQNPKSQMVANEVTEENEGGIHIAKKDPSNFKKVLPTNTHARKLLKQ